MRVGDSAVMRSRMLFISHMGVDRRAFVDGGARAGLPYVRGVLVNMPGVRMGPPLIRGVRSAAAEDRVTGVFGGARSDP